MSQKLKYLTYQQLEKALENMPQGTIFKFIQENVDAYSEFLDDEFYKQLTKNDFHGRYWELLACCLLIECCGAKIKKPFYKKNTSHYDLDVIINNCKFSLECVVPKDADNSVEQIPDDIICIAQAVRNKKTQYVNLIKDDNIKGNKIYDLKIGLFGFPLASLQFPYFLITPTCYLGAFFRLAYL